MTSTSTLIRAQLQAPLSCLDDVTSVLALAGLRPSSAAAVGLLITDRDDPAAADPWSVASLPHLAVRLGSESVRVGPFVHPGVTACLRCLDAAGSPAAPRAAYGDVDRALRTLALGWAVRDVATWQSGQLPTTWSSTVTIHTDLQPEFALWQRHPHCGCSWGLSASAG